MKKERSGDTHQCDAYGKQSLTSLSIYESVCSRNEIGRRCRVAGRVERLSSDGSELGTPYKSSHFTM